MKVSVTVRKTTREEKVKGLIGWSVIALIVYFVFII